MYSAINQSAATSPGNLTIKASVNAIPGAVAYAWFVNGTSSLIGGFKFWYVTPYPTALISNLPAAANQALNASDPVTALDLSVDHSYNNIDFDGMTTIGFNSVGAAQPSYWKDFNGAGFTSNGDGTIKEFEDVLDYFWQTYKLTFDAIYVGGSLISAVSKAVITTGGGASAAQRIIFDTSGDGTLKAGTKLVAYYSKYSNTGAPKAIPVLTHPWMPDGTVFFHLKNNPYPAAGGTIPSVWQVMSLEDHFSIRWPYRKLQHELGTYCFELLQCYLPFGIANLTGLANKVN